MSWQLLVSLLLAAAVAEAVSDSVSCFVERPGFGLQSEKCPPGAIGCRIRVEGGRVHWHSISRLYDRNHMVCIFPKEYAASEGCVERAYGFRCWCTHSKCNDEESSWRIVEEFQSGQQYERGTTTTRGQPTTTSSTTTSTTTSTTPSTTSTTTTAMTPTTTTPPPTSTVTSRQTRRMGVVRPSPTIDWRREDDEEEDEEGEYDDVDGIRSRDTRGSFWANAASLSPSLASLFLPLLALLN